MGKLAVVVVAAGKGTRMRSPVSKQYILLQDKPILIHTLQRFQEIELIDEMIVVVGKEEIGQLKQWAHQYELSKVSKVIAGGEHRQASVYEGLRVLHNDVEWVMVHDGVRPFVPKSDIIQLAEKVKQVKAAILAVPVKQTIKTVNPEGMIECTPDRTRLWSAQTPQAFSRSLLLEAYQKAIADHFLGTDDAMLVERLGVPVYVVEGDYKNIKITTSEDLQLARMILEERKQDD